MVKMTLNRTLPLLLASAFVLAGCNGAADGTTDPDTPDNSYSITLSYQSVVDGQCSDATTNLSFYLTEKFCAVASLKNSSGAASGQLVEFILPFGDATPASKLTDSNGLAVAMISSDVANAGEMSVLFTPTGADAVSASRNYEFLAVDTLPPSETVSIRASIHDATGPVTRFKVDETVQLQAQLTNSSNEGIADALVSFNLGGVSLTPSSALTNTQGVASISYTPTDTELGANTLTVSSDYQDVTYTNTTVYEVLNSDPAAPEGTIKMGYFASADQFVEGELATTLTPVDGDYKVSAGGTFGVTATLAMQNTDGTFTRLQTPTSISFLSDCAISGDATLDSPVTTLSGSASSTFSDISCSGNSERDEQITASASIGAIQYSATLPFKLSRQTLANLSFESAEPTQIRIKGSGGTGSSESSLVTFKVSSANGQPAAQQTVDFSLDTVVGGLSFANGQSTDTSITNAQGLVSVRVLSGTVPTPVRVMAKATDIDTGETIISQSEQLTVNTGLPHQLGFSLSASVINPEAHSNDGEEVTINAFASDSFGNPTPDDTVINFTTEGGLIEPSCATQNGRCSVTWTSANPRVPDHRVTVLAYALGHETFFDTNGNNMFDAADGGAILNACLDTTNAPKACTGNGMDIMTYHPDGFIDLGDAFRDDDESGIRRSGEPFFNTSGSGNYSGPDGLFNGPQCEGSLCGTGQANKTYIRKALVLTMSGSTPTLSFTQDGNAFTPGITDPMPIPVNGTSNFSINLADSANQIMPFGTTVDVTATLGTVDFNGYTVPNRNQAGGTSTSFRLTNSEAGSSLVTITITTPGGIVTTQNFTVIML